MDVDALIADNGMRKRDERFATQATHKAKPDPLSDKSGVAKPRTTFSYTEFTFDPDALTCHCPAGKKMWRTGRNTVMSGKRVIRFRGAEFNCVGCPLRAKCIRKPETTKTRQVAFFLGTAPGRLSSYGERMRERIDSPQGRALSGRRFATVEPVFGNIRYNKKLNRFTVRG
ncbi:MAG TPA: transposase [Terriglobales bacterium]|nr:transposase [Terriglobales bacterium]